MHYEEVKSSQIKSNQVFDFVYLKSILVLILAVFIIPSCTKDESSFKKSNVSDLSYALAYSIDQGKMSFDSESDLHALYDSLHSLIDNRIDKIVDSLELLNYSIEDISLYFDSISFDDYLPIKNFVNGKQYNSAFDTYYDDLIYELEEDNIDFEYIDTTFLLVDPVWMVIFNSDWQIVIADSLIDLQAIPKSICAQSSSGCCPIAGGQMNVTFNNGNNRFVTIGRFAPTWWTVVIGGPLGAGVAGLSNFNMKLTHQTRDSRGRWGNKRTDLKIDSVVQGLYNDCSLRMATANNRTWRNRSNVSWTRTIHSGGLGVLFVAWSGTTGFDSVHLPTSFNLVTNLSY